MLSQAAIFAITDTKLYVLVVTLSTQDNAKELQQLKSGFKHTFDWNKYQSKTTRQNAPNQYLDYLIDPSFQGVNSFFVLATEKVEDCNVMIDGKNVFDQPIKNNIKIYDYIREITPDQEDDYTTGCLLDYNYF